MAKYIKCDCCGKKIEFGATVYQFNGYCGLYCSPECFTDVQADIHILHDELAEDCCCTVYDEAREREIREQMEKHKQELERLQRELELLTTQN